MQRRLACLTMQNAKGREWPATRPMTAASLLGVEPRASIAGPSARFDPRTPLMAYSVRRFFRFLLSSQVARGPPPRSLDSDSVPGRTRQNRTPSSRMRGACNGGWRA